jgi:hypothetical protein
MMKKIFMGLYALTLAFVCSCSRDDDGASADQGLEITFSGDLAGKKWSDSDDATRATDATWTDNDEIGIYMTNHGSNSLLTAMANRRYRYSLSTGKFTPAPSNHPLYYPGDGANVNFVAYYPYSPTAATANTVTFNFADQSTQSLKEAVDFCFHRGTTPYNKASADATHPSMRYFNHKFSKIRITVNGTNGPDLSDLVVKLTGMPASATVNLAALTSNPNDLSALDVGTTPTTITAWTTRTATSATVEAIVAPHPGGSDFTGRTITFATNNGVDVKTYTIPDAMTFESGKVYNYTVTYSNTSPDSEDGMTNSFMVIPGQPLTFEVKRAYNSTNKVFAETLRAGAVGNYPHLFTPAVLWDDNGVISGTPTVSGTGNTATVTVQTTNNHGNAVVAIKVGSTIVWSYHIWVTDYVPEVGVNTATNNGFVFMNRNLGATAAGSGLTARGLFYQWGRKDPFPGAKAGTAGYAARAQFNGINENGFGTKGEVKVTGTDNAACIIQSIQTPTTFFTNYDKTNYDWLKTLKDDLWNIRNSGEDIKTVYDPCPTGWRVPAHRDDSPTIANSPWYGYTGISYTEGNTAANNFGDNAIYPACGYRSYVNGPAVWEGEEGFYWTASTKNTVALGLFFSNTPYIVLSTPDRRASGFSVRCVREL